MIPTACADIIRAIINEPSHITAVSPPLQELKPLKTSVHENHHLLPGKTDERDLKGSVSQVSSYTLLLEHGKGLDSPSPHIYSVYPKKKRKKEKTKTFKVVSSLIIH